MTSKQLNTDVMTWVAMDIAKNKNDVLVESPTGKQKTIKLAIFAEVRETTRKMHLKSLSRHSRRLRLRGLTSNSPMA